MSTASNQTPVLQLRNIGPASAQWLEEIDIGTRADLERIGPVLAYRVLKSQQPSVSLNLLYALHGALTGERWDQLSTETRERLKREAEEALQKPPDKAT